MTDISEPGWFQRHPRDVLNEHGIRARKALGQNFLISGGNLDRVVEAAVIGPDEIVLEIGTGLGRLTARLAARAAHVVTVEIDKPLHAIAASNLRQFTNVTLLCCDFLRSKHRINSTVTEAAGAACGKRPLKVVSNLPYSISSPAIVNLLEWEIPVREMYLMLQREVAERLTAEPGVPEYGPLTVSVDYWATSERLFRLPQQAFWPQPEVASSLVKIARRPERVKTEGYAAFAAVVRKLFSTRRKSLGAILRRTWGRQTAEQVLAELGIDAGTRPGRLATGDFEAIAALAGPPPD